MKRTILRFNCCWQSFENEVESLTLHDEKTSNDFIWTFHTSQSSHSIKFNSQVSENTIKCNESTFRSNQQFVLQSVSQSATLTSIRQLRQCIWSFKVKCSFSDIKSTVCPFYSSIANKKTNKIVSAFDDFSIECNFRRFIAKDVWSTNFRNRQSSACIWSFYDQMQQSDNQTTSSVHSMISASNAAVLITDNFVSVSDRSKSDAIFLTSDNTVSASDDFSIKCSMSDITFNRQCI